MIELLVCILLMMAVFWFGLSLVQRVFRLLAIAGRFLGRGVFLAVKYSVIYSVYPVLFLCRGVRPGISALARRWRVQVITVTLPPFPVQEDALRFWIDRQSKRVPESGTDSDLWPVAHSGEQAVFNKDIL